MRKKKFRLDPILKYYHLLEDQVRLELVSLLNQKIKENKKLMELLNTQTQFGKTLSQMEKEGILIRELKLYYTYLDILNSKIRDQQNLVRKIDVKYEQKQVEFFQSSQETKKIAQLKEKKINEIHLKEKRNDRKKLDEISVQMHSSRKG